MIAEIIEARKETPLQKLLQDEFGGWPVLESTDENGYKWNESSFDWQVHTLLFYQNMQVNDFWMKNTEYIIILLLCKLGYNCSITTI